MIQETAQYTTRFEIELFEGILSSHVYPWHWHDHYTIVLIESGSMKYVYRNEEIIISAGQVLVVNPLTSHYNFPLEQCVYKAVFLPVHYILTEGYSILHFQRDALQSPSLFDDLQKGYAGIKNTTTKDECDKAAAFLSGLLMAHVSYELKTQSFDKRILPAVDFIKHHFDKKLTVDKVAAICHLSRFHFQRLFKQSTGLTVHEYIQQLRTEYSKSLLRKGIHIADTSFETGYFDQSHFHKAFKKMWVANPSRFT